MDDARNRSVKETPMMDRASTWYARERAPAPAVLLPDGRRVTPIATIARLELPFGVLTRLRPWAVRIEDGERIQELRIRDGTALATTALIAGELVVGAVVLSLLWRTRRAQGRSPQGRMKR
jgi:hypothetical protein